MHSKHSVDEPFSLAEGNCRNEKNMGKTSSGDTYVRGRIKTFASTYPSAATSSPQAISACPAPASRRRAHPAQAHPARAVGCNWLAAFLPRAGLRSREDNEPACDGSAPGRTRSRPATDQLQRSVSDPRAAVRDPAIPGKGHPQSERGDSGGGGETVSTTLEAGRSGDKQIVERHKKVAQSANGRPSSC